MALAGLDLGVQDEMRRMSLVARLQASGLHAFSIICVSQQTDQPQWQANFEAVYSSWITVQKSQVEMTASSIIHTNNQTTTESAERAEDRHRQRRADARYVFLLGSTRVD